MLLLSINEKQLAGDTMTKNVICEKAKALYTGHVSKLPGKSTEKNEGLKVCREWFDNFMRSCIHTVVRSREIVSSNAKATGICCSVLETHGF